MAYTLLLEPEDLPPSIAGVAPIEVVWVPNLLGSAPTLLWITDNEGVSVINNPLIYRLSVEAILSSLQWADALSESFA